MKAAQFGILMLLSGLVALPVSAQNPSNPKGQRSFSSTKRFAVSGASAERNVQLAAFMEELYGRVQKEIGMQIPGHPRGLLLSVEFHFQESIEGARFSPERKWMGTNMMQTLRVLNPTALEQEDFLERITGQLIERFVVGRQDPKTRARYERTASEWFDVGCAQNLYPNTRKRNRTIVQQLVKENKLPDVQTILGWDQFNPGRMVEKSVVGVWYEFIREKGDFSEVFVALCDEWARGEAVGDDLMAELLGMRSGRTLDQEWAVYAAGQSERFVNLSARPVDRINALHALMQVRPAELIQNPPADAPASLAWHEMITHRDERWQQAISSAMVTRLHSLHNGDDKSFQEVVDVFVSYFEELGKSKRGLFGSRKAEKALRNELSKGLALLKAYEVRERSRTLMLDRVEASMQR